MEFLIILAFFGYLFYLRNYADLRTASEKEDASLSTQPDSAQQEDFDLEENIRATSKPDNPLSTKTKSEFVDRRFVASLIMVIFTSATVVFVIHNSKTVHVPYLVAVISAIIIGFAEPQKGWFLAVAQCILIFTGYMVFAGSPENKGQQELENFGVYGSMILTFAASFLGAFLKRALNMK